MIKQIHHTQAVGGYCSGHSWYYLLGNPILTPKQIMQAAKASNYRGYRREEIETAAAKPEPQRSEALRTIRQQLKEELRKDISGYRQCALQLHRHLKKNGFDPSPTVCEDVHTNISLKHNQIYNGFAHLALLDELPEQQQDLFEFV
jgi:hypothetical protein